MSPRLCSYFNPSNWAPTKLQAGLRRRVDFAEAARGLACRNPVHRCGSEIVCADTDCGYYGYGRSFRAVHHVETKSPKIEVKGQPGGIGIRRVLSLNGPKLGMTNDDPKTPSRLVTWLQGNNQQKTAILQVGQSTEWASRTDTRLDPCGGLPCRGCA